MNSLIPVTRIPGQTLVETILKFQPLFAVPIYFSVLVDTPPLWLSLIIAIIPLGLRFWLTRHFIQRTPFDVPILFFILGTVVGLVVAPNKEVALGALSSTLASILIYYGIVSNSEAENKYWLWMAATICVITLLMSIWFFSQGNGRQFFFNQWAFKLFEGLPGNSDPPLSWNSVGALLAVVIPPLFSVVLFKNSQSIRKAGLIFGLIFLVILFLTVSGGGWIAVTCGLAFVLICWRLWTIGVIVPAVGLITSAVIIFYNKTPWLMQAFSSGSLMYRVEEIWAKTIPLFKNYDIVTGLGLGSWLKLFIDRYGANNYHLHNSYFQFYTDTGILGIVTLMVAAGVFIRLSMNIISSSRHDSWYGVGVGLIGSIIAGAIFACYDVTITGTVVSATSYVYLSIPLLWVLAALFVVSNKRLSLSQM
jgi:O-antigen ligase